MPVFRARFALLRILTRHSGVQFIDAMNYFITDTMVLDPPETAAAPDAGLLSVGPALSMLSRTRQHASFLHVNLA